MIDFDTVELIASLERKCNTRGLYSRCPSRHNTLDVCAWKMKVEIQRLKETIDDVARFALMCHRRQLSKRGDKIDHCAFHMVLEIMIADHARNPQ